MDAPLYGAQSKSSIERKRRLAEALLQSATDASPVGHWTQALARGVQGLASGYIASKADKEDSSRRSALVEALMGAKSPSDLEALGLQYDEPMAFDIASGRRRDAELGYQHGRDTTQDSQWQQSFDADQAYRQQSLAARSQQEIPSGYRAAQGGNLEAIPGGPADPNKPIPARSLRPTTDQANAAGFYDRLRSSNEVLSDPAVTQAAMEWGQNAMNNNLPMGLGNYMTSPEFQKYDQASRDFVNAVLRKESGAAISESEFQNARIQYFPQPGDTPEKIAQKAKNREVVINAMHRTAGPALSGQPAGTQMDSGTEFGEVGQIPEGAVVEDEQGARYRKENGTLVPVQ